MCTCVCAPRVRAHGVAVQMALNVVYVGLARAGGGSGGDWRILWAGPLCQLADVSRAAAPFL